MNANQLKDDLSLLKTRLDSIESQLEGQLNEILVREEKWKKIDEQLDELLKSNEEIVKFNIGGKVFHTRKETLMKDPDCLLARIVDSEKVDLNEELFFDRNPKYFPYILDYLRYGKINYKRFNKVELMELKEDVDYYEIAGIRDYLKEYLKDIEFVNFEFSGEYTYDGSTAGTNRLEDLKERSLTKGICASPPGWIIIELNKVWEFDEIEIGGYKGNSRIWYVGNGSLSIISTSLDKENWNDVGTLPQNYGDTIQKVKLTKSKGRYIRFSNNSYCGIGYLKIKNNSSK